jgi:predicted O-linked N-acetylglucosamine transferase (SPINDLY family)
LQPKCAESWNELGIVLVTQKQFPEAVDSFQRAIDLRPNLAEAHNNLGHAYWSLGQYDRAIPAYRHAIDARPGYAEAYNNLGRTLADHRHFADALSAYRHAIELKPDFPEVHNNLGNLLRDQGRLDQAITAYRHALALRPAYAEAQNNLGAALTSQGRLEEALDVYRRALAFNPGHAGIHSNVLLAIQFAPSLDRDVLQKEFQCWNEKFSARFKHSCTSISIDCPQKHRLRVGYVSPDFRDHVIGRNLLPLFRHHDTQNFEIYCYSAVARPDHLTAEFQRHAAGWRPIADLTDEAVAATIQEDQIDILVDLTQHLFANRLPVFCQRPAPVQVSFAGYPESTGLDAIRYRISDRYLECHTDRNPSPELYLLDSFWCYDPLGVDLTVNHLPALENHAITFGCLNNFFKINETLLALWARVLQRVPSSRLLLLTAFGSHRRDTLEVFRRHGVSPERVEFVTARPRQDYLALYHQLDIVLDSYPYNGHTTSLDALWMGVPIVSLVGDRPISRAGLSQLTNLSLPELATFSEDQYVQTAAQLARDLPRLQDLRTTLRNRLEASVIMDGTRFARGIETAYRIFLCHRCTQTAPLPS